MKPFECSLCSKQFTQRGSLYRQIKSSHKEHKPRTLVLRVRNKGKDKGSDSDFAEWAEYGQGTQATDRRRLGCK